MAVEEVSNLLYHLVSEVHFVSLSLTEFALFVVQVEAGVAVVEEEVSSCI